MKLSTNEILYMRAFETITGIVPKGCVVKDSTLNFLVGSGQIGAAVGKNGKKVQKLRNKIGKKIQIFEYAETPIEFIKKAFKGTKIEEIKIEANKKLILVTEATEKKKILQNMTKLKNIKEILKKSYGIEEFKIR